MTKNSFRDLASLELVLRHEAHSVLLILLALCWDASRRVPLVPYLSIIGGILVLYHSVTLLRGVSNALRRLQEMSWYFALQLALTCQNLLLSYSLVYLSLGEHFKPNICSIWEAVYFSLITWATVGYGDFTPVGFGLRLIVIVQIVSSMLFTGIALASFVSSLFSERRMFLSNWMRGDRYTNFLTALEESEPPTGNQMILKRLLVELVVGFNYERLKDYDIRFTYFRYEDGRMPKNSPFRATGGTVKGTLTFEWCAKVDDGRVSVPLSTPKHPRLEIPVYDGGALDQIPGAARAFISQEGYDVVTLSESDPYWLTRRFFDYVAYPAICSIRTKSGVLNILSPLEDSFGINDHERADFLRWLAAVKGVAEASL